MKKSYLAILVVFLILLIDQIVKIWIKSSFEYGHEPVGIFGDWFRLVYVENQGMAFGTTLGNASWSKLVLSLFRLIAVGAIIYYLSKLIKEKAKTGLIIAISMILAGAFGNIIDSMLYDYIFDFDPTQGFNLLRDADGNFQYGPDGEPLIRKTGFLYANVVDMFQFNATWPEWVPYLGGDDVFPAVWNIADFSISCGVGLIILRYKSFFSKPPTEEEASTDEKEIA